MSKTCIKCEKKLDFSCFYKQGGGRSGYRGTCKKCLSITKKQYRKENLEKVRQKEKSYRSTRHEAERIKLWRKNNKEKQRQISARYYENNKEKCIQRGVQYISTMRRKSTQFLIRSNLSRRLNVALKNNQKKGSILVMLGCSIPELKKHLESQFQPGMSWDNYGLHGWHIDHIKPLAAFDLTDENQVKQACHYSNLQPLWAEDNLRKGTKHEQSQ